MLRGRLTVKENCQKVRMYVQLIEERHLTHHENSTEVACFPSNFVAIDLSRVGFKLLKWTEARQLTFTGSLAYFQCCPGPELADNKTFWRLIVTGHTGICSVCSEEACSICSACFP